MNNEKSITFIIILLIICLFEGLTIFEGIGLINDKNKYIINLQNDNNQCKGKLDSIKQDYERLYGEMDG